MDQPPPDQPPPNIAIAPPKLNPKQLWLTLLLPMGLSALGMGLMVLAGSNKAAESILSIGGILVLLATIGCWVAFSKCISQRYLGTSRVVLILAYPVLQVVLIFGAFFAGCLVLVSQSGLY